jgi:hypothetical protein
MQTAVAFLCTGVKALDTDNNKKLTRVMKYLRGTLNMPLALQAENMTVMKCWVNDLLYIRKCKAPEVPYQWAEVLCTAREQNKKLME